MHSITKPRNVIPTVVVLDPATNQGISRIQKSPFIKVEEETEETATNEIEETPVVEETPVADEPIIEEPVTDENSPIEEPVIMVDDGEEDYTNLPSATDEDIQAIIDGYGKDENDSNRILSNNTYEFDDSNIPVATDEDIQAIIDGYVRRY